MPALPVAICRLTVNHPTSKIEHVVIFLLNLPPACSDCRKFQERIFFMDFFLWAEKEEPLSEMRDNVNVECFHYFFTPHARLSCYATVKEFVRLSFIRSSNLNNFTVNNRVCTYYQNNISLQFCPAYNLPIWLYIASQRIIIFPKNWGAWVSMEFSSNE